MLPTYAIRDEAEEKQLLNTKFKKRMSKLLLATFLLEISHSSIGILQIRTFCAWIFLAISISYASVTNYS